MRAGTIGELRSAEELIHAARELRRRGYRRLDAFTPYPIKGLEDALGMRRSRLGWMVFPIAMVGALLGFFVQWWCNALDYPINVGGRPLASVPAWIPITFEAGVLSAGLGGLFLLILLSGFPDLHTPLAEVTGFERATIDSFWVGVDERDPSFNEVQVERDLREVGAVVVMRARGRWA